jgi:riboflavin biosynthesis protein ribF
VITFINTTDIKITEKTAVVIGKFDGEHRGHRKLFRTLKEEANKKGLKTVVFSFRTLPSNIVRNKHTTQIFTNVERRKKLEELGIDYYIEYPFDMDIAKLSGEEFLTDILIKKLGMAEIVAGDDAAFGYKKSGNIELLNRLSKTLGFDVKIIEKEKDDFHNDISSTLIRTKLDEGDMEEANKLLGGIYSISGIVEEGNKIGATIGFPTLNLFPSNEKHLPKYGVYASRVRIGDDDTLYLGLTNVGSNPSIENDKKNHVSRVETYLYNFEANLYGREIEVYLYKYIRPEMKFGSLEELKKQLSNDKQEVLNFLNSQVR